MAEPKQPDNPFMGPMPELPGPFQGQAPVPKDPLEAAIWALLLAEMRNQAKHKYTLPGGHDENGISGRPYPMGALYRHPTIGEQIMDWKGEQLRWQHDTRDFNNERLRERQKREGGLYGQ